MSQSNIDQLTKMLEERARELGLAPRQRIGRVS